MWFYRMLFFVAFLVVGAAFVVYGRTLPTWQEDEKNGRDDSFLYEFCFGPAGYNRARTILFGAVSVCVGIIGIIVTLIAELFT